MPKGMPHTVDDEERDETVGVGVGVSNGVAVQRTYRRLARQFSLVLLKYAFLCSCPTNRNHNAARSYALVGIGDQATVSKRIGDQRIEKVFAVRPAADGLAGSAVPGAFIRSTI